MQVKKISRVDRGRCVACGACRKACPKNAVAIWKGRYAIIDEDRCIGCGLCEKVCPAESIEMVSKEGAAE